jgi:hypothetical protein
MTLRKHQIVGNLITLTPGVVAVSDNGELAYSLVAP